MDQFPTVSLCLFLNFLGMDLTWSTIETTKGGYNFSAVGLPFIVISQPTV